MALYDVGTRRALGALAGKKGAAVSAGFLPGGKTLATGHADGAVVL